MKERSIDDQLEATRQHNPQDVRQTENPHPARERGDEIDPELLTSEEGVPDEQSAIEQGSYTYSDTAPEVVNDAFPPMDGQNAELTRRAVKADSDEEVHI